MMAWILVSLLASFAGDADVALSPEANIAPPSGSLSDPAGLPPKP
jgi:hypothetical protein